MSGLGRIAQRVLPGWIDPVPSESERRGLAAALTRYRILANVVGVGLLVLVLVGVPLQLAANAPAVVKVVGPLHGFVYIVYLFAAFDMARRARFTFAQMVMMLCAGLLPGLAFVIERKVTARVRLALAVPVAEGDSDVVPKDFGSVN